jgi:hypothetical protein
LQSPTIFSYIVLKIFFNKYLKCKICAIWHKKQDKNQWQLVKLVAKQNFLNFLTPYKFFITTFASSKNNKQKLKTWHKKCANKHKIKYIK